MSEPQGSWKTIRLPVALYDLFVMRMESVLLASGELDIGEELNEATKKLAIERIVQLLDAPVPMLARWLNSGQRK
jgi:hypothetical protein